MRHGIHEGILFLIIIISLFAHIKYGIYIIYAICYALTFITKIEGTTLVYLLTSYAA